MTSTKKLFVVLHLPYQRAALEEVANDALSVVHAGADGVFLIDNHTRSGPAGHFTTVQVACDILRERDPLMFIGANYLGVPADIALRISPKGMFDAVWTDDSGLGDPDAQPRVIAAMSDEATACSASRPGQTVKHYGGFNFKYQMQRSPELARSAASMVDVLATSGDATGQPPTPEKVAEIRAFTPPFIPIAVCSGVNEENIRALRVHADHFLIASSLARSDSIDRPDMAAVRRLVTALRQP